MLPSKILRDVPKRFNIRKNIKPNETTKKKQKGEEAKNNLLIL
jgi:hypothetical protein